ncbi:MAG: hypothetical protein WAN75_51075, partial [Xanthobacteraceae bacterium]
REHAPCKLRQHGGSAMYPMLRLTIAAIAVAFISFPASVSAQVVKKEIADVSADKTISDGKKTIA